jgi:Zn-dependent oligopeptidase
MGKSKNVSEQNNLFLESLRKKHVSLHRKYENLFWLSYMGDYSVDARKNQAQKKRDAFYSDVKLKQKVEDALKLVKNKKQKESLEHWDKFFQLYQTPPELLEMKEEISKLEDKMQQKVAKRKEGYINPYTKKFVNTPYLKMRTMMRIDDDERIRKACFDAMQSLSTLNLSDYVKYVGLLNKYAQGLGYKDFYDFKIQQDEGMTKIELFKIFDSIYKNTKYAFANIRKLERKIRGLRKPWNFGYMMSGDFTKEDDQYFPFDEALDRWGRSFCAMGIDFRGGELQLDLLDRKGKYVNGFCHWPGLVHYDDKTRVPGQSNFTCNVVYGQVGSAVNGYITLFHEGGHAAHLLNSKQKDTCLNHEYPPMSTAWVETQSMFLDTVFSSYEWRSRYAYNKEGQVYPFELFKRKVKKLHVNFPLSLNGIIAVSVFEKEIYETKDLTEGMVKEITKRNMRKYFDFSEDSLGLLNIPHIYSWTSACSYHGYGLADIAVSQWRAYFKKKYGNIVDNLNVGKEMKSVWEIRAKKDFREFIIMATGKKLSASDWIKDRTKSIEAILSDSQKSANQLKKVKKVKSVKFNADIRMVDGKKTISTNKKSFEDMEQRYAKWLG